MRHMNMRKAGNRVWAYPLVAVLSLIPAAVHGLSGVIALTHPIQDCIYSDGGMQEELLDGSSPSTKGEVTEKGTDGQGNVHWEYRQCAIIADATKEFVKPTQGGSTPATVDIDFAVGSQMGNAAGNNRKVQKIGGHFNNGYCTLKGTCTPYICPYGEWKCDLRQRTKGYLAANWTKQADGQAPSYDVHVEFKSIDSTAFPNGMHSMCLLRLRGEFDPNTGHVTTIAEGDIEDFPFLPMEVSDGGSDTSEVGVYTSAPWSPDAGDRWSCVEAEWEAARIYDRACAQTASHAPEHLFVAGFWGLSIEDRSQGVALDLSKKSALAVTLEWRTLIMIWSVEVTRNCPGSSTDCPCTDQVGNDIWPS